MKILDLSLARSLFSVCSDHSTSSPRSPSTCYEIQKAQKGTLDCGELINMAAVFGSCSHWRVMAIHLPHSDPHSPAHSLLSSHLLKPFLRKATFFPSAGLSPPGQKVCRRPPHSSAWPADPSSSLKPLSFESLVDRPYCSVYPPFPLIYQPLGSFLSFLEGFGSCLMVIPSEANPVLVLRDFNIHTDSSMISSPPMTLPFTMSELLTPVVISWSLSSPVTVAPLY